jgi:hypothetical protein
VVSVSTIGFVTVLTVWYVRTVTNPMVETEITRKNSYKPNGRNRDHTVRTVTNTMVETETGFVTVLTVWSLFLPLDCNCSYGVVSVSTIGFITVLTVWSLFLPLGCNCSYGMVSVSTIGL